MMQNMLHIACICSNGILIVRLIFHENRVAKWIWQRYDFSHGNSCLVIRIGRERDLTGPLTRMWQICLRREITGEESEEEGTPTTVYWWRLITSHCHTASIKFLAYETPFYNVFKTGQFQFQYCYIPICKMFMEMKDLPSLCHYLYPSSTFIT